MCGDTLTTATEDAQSECQYLVLRRCTCLRPVLRGLAQLGLEPVGQYTARESLSLSLGQLTVFDGSFAAPWPCPSHLRHFCCGISAHQPSCGKDMRTNDSEPSLRASFGRFEELILKHAVDRPPWTTGVLNPKDVGAITDYVATR